jgi:uncharacterized protein (TIGR02118 family)
MIVTVIYPKTESSHFDHDYYTKTHMQLVQRLWGAHGMVGAQVLRGTGSLGGEPPYELITLLEFPNQEAWLKAAGAHADEIMEDVPRFTNIRPIVQFNERVA